MPTPGESEIKEGTLDYRTRSQFPALHAPRYPVHKSADRLEPYLRVLVERIPHIIRVKIGNLIGQNYPVLRKQADEVIALIKPALPQYFPI